MGRGGFGKKKARPSPERLHARVLAAAGSALWDVGKAEKTGADPARTATHPLCRPSGTVESRNRPRSPPSRAMAISGRVSGNRNARKAYFSPSRNAQGCESWPWNLVTVMTEFAKRTSRAQARSGSGRGGASSGQAGARSAHVAVGFSFRAGDQAFCCPACRQLAYRRRRLGGVDASRRPTIGPGLAPASSGPPNTGGTVEAAPGAAPARGRRGFDVRALIG